jgi:hypothetical protein
MGVTEEVVVVLTGAAGVTGLVAGVETVVLDLVDVAGVDTGVAEGLVVEVDLFVGRVDGRVVFDKTVVVDWLVRGVDLIVVGA